MKVSTKLKASFSRLLLLTAFLCISLSAKAIDWIDLQLGTEYEVPEMGSFYGKFVAPKSGIVTVSYSTGGGAPDVYYTEALDSMVKVNRNNWGLDFNAVSGTTYYFADKFVMSGGVMTLTMDDEVGIALVEASPEAGSTLDLGAGAQISLLFNKSILVTDGAILYGDGKSAALNVYASGKSATSELRTVLYSLLSNGKVKGGDEITVQLTGVRASSDESILYNQDGVFEIKYICPELPVSLTGEDVPAKFLSYWLPGDKSGVMTLTFSGALDPTAAQVVFCYGNSEGAVGEYYEETIPYTVSGQTMTIDLTGVVRDPKSMIKSGTVYSVCMLKVLSVRDEKGNYVYTPYNGALGSFTYELTFAMASGKYMIEFTPKSGSDLTDYDNIEVYLTGTDNVNYDGLQVAYTGANGRQTEVLTAADYTVEIDGDEATYTIPVKEVWKNSSDVVVSLRNFISKAGESNYSEAKYNAFVVTGINPTSGSTLGFLNTGDVVSIQTNRSKNIKNFVYEIHDLNAETADDFIIKSLSYLSTDADSTTWTASVYGSYKFYTGHKYSFVFKAYNTQSIAGTPFATDSIVINGGTTPYEYSDTQFESISPVAGTALTDATEGVFTLTFDGLVNLSAETTFINLGQGATLAFAKIENLTDDTKYGNQWRLTLPEGYLEQHPGALSLTVVAVDLLGKRVQGNQGEDEGTYFNFAYTNTVGVPTVTCTDPAEGVSVESLSVITITCTDGIAESYIGGQIEVKKAMTGETVATVTEIEPVYTSDNWDDPATSMKLKLSQTLTEGGRYFVTIPEGYFYLGSQAQYTSEALTFGFVIEPKDDETPADATPVVADPADGSTVTSLKEIVLTFTGEKAAGEEGNCSEPINITDASNNVVATAQLSWGTDDNQMVATLSQEITADGVYTITFPAGKFALGEEGDHWSTAFTLTYTIGTASGINTIATDKVAALSVYNLQGACVLRHADAAAVKALPAGIYVINGVKTVIR